ncbi:hypothetical protein ACVJGD_007612 [Bradyrhizobium sp. USDA 10063]
MQSGERAPIAVSSDVNGEFCGWPGRLKAGRTGAPPRNDDIFPVPLNDIEA